MNSNALVIKDVHSIQNFMNTVVAYWTTPVSPYFEKGAYRLKGDAEISTLAFGWISRASSHLEDCPVCIRRFTTSLGDDENPISVVESKINTCELRMRACTADELFQLYTAIDNNQARIERIVFTTAHILLRKEIEKRQKLEALQDQPIEHVETCDECKKAYTSLISPEAHAFLRRMIGLRTTLKDLIPHEADHSDEFKLLLLATEQMEFAAAYRISDELTFLCGLEQLLSSEEKQNCITIFRHAAPLT